MPGAPTACSVGAPSDDSADLRRQGLSDGRRPEGRPLRQGSERGDDDDVGLGIPDGARSAWRGGADATTPGASRCTARPLARSPPHDHCWNRRLERLRGSAPVCGGRGGVAGRAPAGRHRVVRARGRLCWRLRPHNGFDRLPQLATRDRRAPVERRCSARNRAARAELVVAEGSPAAVLRDESAAAELLVVGSGGHGGFAGLLLGSVSQQMRGRHVQRPVVIVRGD